MTANDTITAIFVIMVVTAAIILICREVACWYWKINKMTSLQQEALDIQKDILKELRRIGAIESTDIRHQGGAQ